MDKDACRVARPQAELAIGNSQQAWRTALQQLDRAPRLQSQLGHPADKLRFAGNVGHPGPFARAKHFERNQGFEEHVRGRELLRFRLN